MADELSLLELRRMKLFTEVKAETNEGNSVYIMRCPGGWLIKHYKAENYTFVPEPSRLSEIP